MPDQHTQQPQTLIEGEDFYREGPYVVFTEACHRKRGYCCGSGCRHCPWRDGGESGAANLSQQKDLSS